MTRPIDETWEHLSGAWPYAVLRKGTAEKIADVWATGQEDGNGTADLIAQAPAMARLLLKLEWGADICIGYDNMTALGCSSCGGLQHDPGSRADFDHQTIGHDPDCALIAVLRAAGVVD